MAHVGSRPDDLLELDQQVCFALSVASRAVIGIYRPVLAPLGLTHPQYLVMLAMWQYSPLTVKVLSSHLHLEPATISPLLKRLETAGLIERQRDPDDERALRLTLTESGRALRERALDVPGQVMERTGMSFNELQELHAVLTSVISRVDPDAIDSRTSLPE
jgi:DNA-binding MarR family transcriptional regulator